MQRPGLFGCKWVSTSEGSVPARLPKAGKHRAGASAAFTLPSRPEERSEVFGEAGSRAFPLRCSKILPPFPAPRRPPTPLPTPAPRSRPAIATRGHGDRNGRGSRNGSTLPGPGALRRDSCRCSRPAQGVARRGRARPREEGEGAATCPCPRRGRCRSRAR